MKWIFISTPKDMETKKIQWVCEQALKRDSVPIDPQLLFPEANANINDKVEEAEKELLGYCDELWAVGKEDKQMQRHIAYAEEECLTVLRISNLEGLQETEQKDEFTDVEFHNIILLSCLLEEKTCVNRQVIERILFSHLRFIRMAGKRNGFSSNDYADMIADVENIPKATVRLILQAEAEEVAKAGDLV